MGRNGPKWCTFCLVAIFSACLPERDNQWDPNGADPVLHDSGISDRAEGSDKWVRDYPMPDVNLRPDINSWPDAAPWPDVNPWPDVMVLPDMALDQAHSSLDLWSLPDVKSWSDVNPWSDVMVLPDKALDQAHTSPDLWPLPDVKSWSDLISNSDMIPWAPDLFPLPACDALFKAATDGYHLCTESGTTCRFFHDEGFLGGSYSCNQLCQNHKCLGAWDTAAANKCSTSNPSSCSTKYNTGTCICSKW